MQNTALSYMPPGPGGLGFLEVEVSDGLDSAVLSLRFPAKPEKVLELASSALLQAVARLSSEPPHIVRGEE